MTLCVAAECQRHKRFFNAIVFATDFAVEGEVAVANIGRKLTCGTSEWYPILLAGTQTRATTLARIIFGITANKTQPVDKESFPLNWDAILKEAVLYAKAAIADEIVSGKFGLSYEHFLQIGKNSLPDEAFRDTVSEIEKASLDCWLLVLTFSHTDGKIYRIGASGIVEVCDHFAAIGSGSYIAESSLFQRSQNESNDLGTTIYNVYEAMRLGAHAPGVSEQFQIGIAEWDWYEDPNPTNHGWVKMSFLEPRYYTYLDKRFARFGPKRMTTVRLKPRFIKEEERSIVLTPKGECDPEQQKAIRRAKAARDREARKRAIRQSVSQTSAGQQ